MKCDLEKRLINWDAKQMVIKCMWTGNGVKHWCFQSIGKTNKIYNQKNEIKGNQGKVNK